MSFESGDQHTPERATFGVPGHAPHHGLVAVVDHLFVPAALVEHPDDDKAVLVAGSQLLMYLVPTDHLQVVIVVSAFITSSIHHSSSL